MYSKEEKIRRLKSLSRLEMEVLFYFGQGMKDEEICLKLGGLAQKTLITRRTGIYKTLGIDVPDKDKQDFLAQEYSPVIPIVCPNEEALKHWRPIILEENGKIKEENKTTSEGKQKPASATQPVKIKKEKSNLWIILLTAVASSIITLAVVGIVGYIIFVNLSPRLVPSQVTVVVTATPEPVTATLQPSEVPVIALTNTVIPTPTDTFTPGPTNTETPIPSPTYTPIPTLTPTPELALPFSDNFDNGINPAWKFTVGDWMTSDGRLTPINNDNWNWITLDVPSWKNYKVKVDEYLHSYNGEAAVAVRVNPQNPKTIALKIDTAFYDIYWTIFSKYNEFQNIEGRGSADYPNPIRIEVQVTGNLFISFVNGKEIKRITYPGFESGGVSLIASCFNYGCPSFDNFSIEPLP